MAFTNANNAKCATHEIGRRTKNTKLLLRSSSLVADFLSICDSGIDLRQSLGLLGPVEPVVLCPCPLRIEDLRPWTERQ